jgi:hypothetical protein
MPGFFSFGPRRAGGMPGNVQFEFSGPTPRSGDMSAERAAEIFSQIFGSGGGMGGDIGEVMSRLGGMEHGTGRKRGGRGGLPAGLSGFPGFAGLGGMGGGGIDFSNLGGAIPKKRHAASAGAGVLPPGTKVKVCGLSDTSREGAVGQIESHDGSRDRYTVLLQPSGDRIAVKPSNLRQRIEQATVVGTSHPSLNGRQPAVAVYDPATGRYRCEGLPTTNSSMTFKRENLVLPRSTRVAIEGVRSRPSLNGQPAVVIDVDREAQRYLVRLDSDEMVRLKFGAVAALPA